MKLPDLLKYKEQIQKSVGKETILMDLLNILLGWNASPDLLKSSKIGITVNELRKSSNNPKIQELSKTIIIKWKGDVEKLKDQSQEEMLSSTTKSSESNKPLEKIGRTISSDNITPHSTMDKIRDKCVEMIYSAVAGDTVVFCGSTACEVSSALVFVL